jgi:hypothetical protein
MASLETVVLGLVLLVKLRSKGRSSPDAVDLTLRTSRPE